MLDKIIFNRCMAFILMTHDVEINEEKNNSFYNLMKNDFTNEEFQKVAERICKGENLYNKYPTPPMFYQYKTSKEDECETACEDFLNRVEEYLSLNFVPSSWKQDFIDNLNESEFRILQRYGGISTLWSDCHRDDMPRSVSNVLKELGESFKNNYVIQTKVDNAIEYAGNKELADKTQNLLAGCLKKMGN